MKKFICIFACMAISLVLFAGCSDYSSSVANETKSSLTETVPSESTKTKSSLTETVPSESTKTKRNLTETAPIESTKTIDWKPTQYEIVNKLDGVNMVVKKVTTSSTELTVAFKNNSSSQCIYGEYFCLEKKINGRWYQVPVAIKGDYAFTSIGYNLAAGGDGERIINWNWLYGSLDKGEYRIVKDISNARGKGNNNTYYLAAEFTIN